LSSKTAAEQGTNLAAAEPEKKRWKKSRMTKQDQKGVLKKIREKSG